MARRRRHWLRQVFWRLEIASPGSGRRRCWQAIGLYTTKRYAENIRLAYTGRTRLVRQVGLEKGIIK